MSHDHDRDEPMNEDLGGYIAVNTAQGARMAPPSDSELADRDRVARENYDIKLYMIKDKVMYKPNLDTLYFNQAEAVMTNVPHDLQLPIVLADYDSVRRFSFYVF